MLCVNCLLQVLVPLLSRLPDREDGQRPVLYACENDHGAAKAVGNKLYTKVCVL
jgi:hypothetical protein